MKLYDKKPDYVRLDDDVSFQILRTNPTITTNTKLMYDGTNLFLDSYSANALLSTNKYKHKKVWKTGMFNKDIRDFLLGTSTSAYDMGQKMLDTIIGDSFDNQFENMYWSGVESINSDAYPQEMGFVAPLYIRKKRPNYFVIFKINSPSNTNLKYNFKSLSFGDKSYSFKDDIQSNISIIKAFDLREGTPIGDYIKKYVEQKDFAYDRSVYVNFTAEKIYYYGIDKSSGVLTQKVESITNQMIENDNTITRTDDWITNGFQRNNLIFPYIINFEFLFDDMDLSGDDDYKFARYFGIYCNDIDLEDLEVEDFIESKFDGLTYNKIITGWEDSFNFEMDESKIYYIKDKKNGIHTISPDMMVLGKIDKNDFTGYESTTISTYCEKMEGYGYAHMIFDVRKPVLHHETITVVNNLIEDASDETNPSSVTFAAESGLGAGLARKNRFSCAGSVEDIAKAIASVINEYNEGYFKWLKAYSSGSKVVIKSSNPGTVMNNSFTFKFDEFIIGEEKIIKLTERFEGGSDADGCLFKVNKDDKDIFFDFTGKDRDKNRYLKCYNGKDVAQVVSVIPYINDDLTVNDQYSMMVTDINGKNVSLTRTNQIEILDKYYPRIGVLSFFPVKDFDFDTVSSSYGNGMMMKSEISKVDKYLENSHKTDPKFDVTLEFDIDADNTDQNTSDKWDISYTKKNIYTNQSVISENSTYLPYGRFLYHNGDAVDNEYGYYFENILPELSTVSKVSPFICKWGYMDDSKDSCENPYRLNTSKIFDTCNFSANTFMQKGDIFEYTHSMPYYMTTDVEGSVDEYQYIENKTGIDVNNMDIIQKWINKFSVKKTEDSFDPFDELFGDTSSSIFTNKRFNRKYSRFLLGNDVNRSTTLFRGVKFEITEMNNGYETKTSKYNDYKFSFIYIPVNNKYVFKKEAGKEEYNYNRIYFVKNDDYKFIVGMMFFYTMSEYTDNSINKFNKGYVYGGCMGLNFYNEYVEKERNEVLMDIFNEMSVNNIKTNINTRKNVFYLNDSGKTDNTYYMTVIEPESINTYDIFACEPVMMTNNEKSVIGSVDISLKSDTNNLNIKIVNRYSGYYNPIFKDILFFNNFEGCPYSNTIFNYGYKDSYGKFGVINNLWFHKVNENKSMEIINTLTPYYPLTGQYALDFKDYNIFSSNWDLKYYTRQLDISNSELCENIGSMKEGMCMFGGKYLNVPDEIEIEGFSGGCEWNDDRISSNIDCEGEMMYKEINNNSVDFYFFIHKRLLRYFREHLKEEFEKYVNPEYSYGNKTSLDDDIDEYVNKNVLKLYRLDRIRMFVKRKKMAIHNNRIENDYTKNLEKSIEDLKKEGFSEVKTISMSRMSLDSFDKKVVYNLRNGEEEEFGFSFVVKKI